jgi:zinc protease
LLVSRRPGAPVCAVQAHVRGGNSLDPRGKEGTSFLAGRLVDQGTRNFSEEELATALENAGGSLSGGSTGISAQVANERWKLVLELLAECLVSPSYPRAKCERQKQRLLDRLLVEQDEPRVQGARLFRGLVYGEHWLGRPEQGEPESVRRIARQDLLDFHRKNWRGKRTVIAFCGDVEPAAVKRFLDAKLSDWEPGADLGPPDTNFPPLARRTALFPAARQQVHVYYGHLGIQRVDPDYAALVVMDHILGTGPGFTNRISRRLRDELGLAYAVNASIHSSAGVLPGTFTAYIGTSVEHMRTAVEGFEREIRSIQAEPVTREELELAKSYLTGAFVLGFERAARRVQTLVSAQRIGLPDDHLERLVRAFGAISARDVQRVARAHLFPRAACLVAAGPVKPRELAALRGSGRGKARARVAARSGRSS